MTNHELIEPTAISVTHARAESNIYYAKKIAKFAPPLNAKLKGMDYRKGLAVRIEARYKLINKVIEENNSIQILELASGLLPRGIYYSKKGIKFVETDLINLVKIKKKILKELNAKNNNLFVEIADATKYNELKKACRDFEIKKELCVTNEGLLRYMTMKEKEKIAKNIKKLLKKFGGVWITCDITIKKRLNSKAKEAMKRMANIDIEKNAFNSVKEAKLFFEKLGFKVKIHKFKEIENEMSITKKFNISKKTARKMIGFPVFEMKIKN